MSAVEFHGAINGLIDNKVSQHILIKKYTIELSRDFKLNRHYL